VLDAYIIEKIKREQERQESDRIPLQIEPIPGRHPHDQYRREERDRRSDRGVVIIDF
jgi:hypothetical protein